MSIEDELRAALAAEAGRTDPPDAWDEIQEGVEAERRRRRFRTAVAGGLAAAAVLAVVLLATPMLRGDDATRVETGVATPGDDLETPGPAEATQYRYAGIWPFSTAEAAQRYPEVGDDIGFHGNRSVDYTDPEATALDFASTYLGFPDPVIVENDDPAIPMGADEDLYPRLSVVPKEGSPMKTVVDLERREGAQAWSVVQARSRNLGFSDHEMQPDDVRSPVRVVGSSTAFEGTIQIEVREDGMVAGESLGDGFATGGSMGEMGPFETSLRFDRPSRPAGALVLTTVSMEDGNVQEASVIRLAFADVARPTSDTTDTTMPPGSVPPAGDGPIEIDNPILPAPEEVCLIPPGAPPGEGEMSVTVFFTCYGDTDPPSGSSGFPVRRVERVVPTTPGVLQASVDALLHGPTAAEREAGMTSFFSEDTAELVLGVTIQGRRAVVDFDPALPSTIPNASTSAGSASFLAELNRTVLQFGTVDEVEYRIGGSCEAFGEWMQSGTCDTYDGG